MGGVASCSMSNRYHKTIWVKYDTERKYVTMKGYTIEGQVGVGGFVVGAGMAVNKCYDWVKIKAQFTPIPADDFIELSVDCKDRKIMYVTIIADGGNLICNTLGQPDKNLIVTKNGCLRSANEKKVMQEHPRFSGPKYCPEEKNPSSGIKSKAKR